MPTLTADRAAELAQIKAARKLRTRLNAALAHLDAAYDLAVPVGLGATATRRLDRMREDGEALLRNPTLRPTA